jgi:hypothetical protein
MSMVSTKLGIQIDRSEDQWNAHSRMCDSLEPDSKATVSSDVQRKKQRSPRISTDDGTEIDFSDEHSQNAYDSMRESFEPDSNVKLSRLLQSAKQYGYRISTEDGIQIDFSDEHPKKVEAPIRVRREGD